MLSVKKRYRAGTQPPANRVKLTTGKTVVAILPVKMPDKNDPPAFFEPVFGKVFNFLPGKLFAKIKVGFL
jgi:hypothetical protein